MTNVNKDSTGAPKTSAALTFFAHGSGALRAGGPDLVRDPA